MLSNLMTRRLPFFSTIWALLSLFPTTLLGQLLIDGRPNRDDDRLYAWYDALDFIGIDGISDTPLWPNKQGNRDRSLWNDFGPSAASSLNYGTLANGLPVVEYIDTVTWSDAGDFGTLDNGFTVFVAAAVRDLHAAYLFTGNQPGGGAEVNANYDTASTNTWTVKGDLNRFATGPVTIDALQYHSLVFGTDGTASHFIDGQLAGQGNVGTASLQGFVLGGRQGGSERATVDFAEVLLYRADLSDSDRQAIETYLRQKYFTSPTPTGDFDGDGLLTAADIDLLSVAVRTGATDANFDLDGDAAIANSDRIYWIEELARTYVGDANLDGEFNSSDFVVVFQAGQYEDFVLENSTWATGDWNGDGEFNSGDFVTAFQQGGYEQGPRAAAGLVPEPSSWALLLVGVVPFRRRAVGALGGEPRSR